MFNAIVKLKLFDQQLQLLLGYGSTVDPLLQL
jgi:hypothetical protein